LSDVLRSGEIVIKGRLPWSSNGTFLVGLCLDGEEDQAVYKPLRGERPLWDYPPGLYRREIAVYVVSEALGWRVVPETIDGDRKSGHCLRGEDGRVWAIDHGLCLAEDPKLRTVIWDFAGQPVPEALVDDVARFAASPPTELGALLNPAELEALSARAAAVLRRPVFPVIRSARAYPWPLV